MTATPRTDALQTYLDQGFVEIDTDSGTGSRVLVHDELCRVVKLNEDRAYHAFVERAKSEEYEHLPKIFSHREFQSEPGNFNDHWFTLTEMEKLHSLSQEEAGMIIDWYTSLTVAGPSSLTSDPFGLLGTFHEIRAWASDSGHNLDLGKSTNYMVRKQHGERIVVVTDPFN